MTVTDLLRNARPSSSAATDPGPSEPPSGRRLLGQGALTALATLAVAWAIALIGWLATGQSTVGFLTVLGIGSDGWLLAHGGRIDVGQAHIAVTPLLAWAGIVLLIARQSRWLAESVGADGPRWRGWLPRDLARAFALFALGYAAVATLASLVTLSAPARPSPLWVAPSVLGTLALGVAVGLARAATPLLELPRPVPMTLVRALPVAGFGAAVLLGVGSVVVLGSVILRFGDVAHVSSELAPGFLGGLVLAGVQVMALPNLALWAVSFCAGSGFQVVAGQPITWSGAHSGLLPMIPALAALPAPGTFPWPVRVVVVVPVVVGAFIGRRAIASVARLSRTRTKAGVAAAAGVGAALLLGLVDLVAGGALGAYRLADMGAPALLMTAFLAVELTLGALCYVAVDALRLNRRR